MAAENPLCYNNGMLHTTCFISPLGTIVLAANGPRLAGLWFEGQKLDGALPKGAPAKEEDDCPVFKKTKYWLDIYFSGRNPDFTPPLEIHGSIFRRTVLSILKSIPYGATRTYGSIARETARRLGLPRMSAQAIGGAVGRNPISIIVPCHRVVGAHGELTGYAGGLDRKRALLVLENAAFRGGKRGWVRLLPTRPRSVSSGRLTCRACRERPRRPPNR